MPNNTLFLIPDISGFTQFVTQTETNHGQHIISELLELLIDANDIGLTLSEVEGDAVFFYTQDIPKKQQLLGLVQSMFIKFHQHLKTYDKSRICQCGAWRRQAIDNTERVQAFHCDTVTRKHHLGEHLWWHHLR